jgi:integrase
MACTLVPFELRLLDGFLIREGLRLGEALELRWRHIDFSTGRCAWSTRRRATFGHGRAVTTWPGPWRRFARHGLTKAAMRWCSRVPGADR